MELKELHRIYFIGIGGIGMSALARYFISRGLKIAGYDRTPTPLTAQLTDEGCLIHYEDNIRKVPSEFTNPDLCQSTLVVYTPAIPVSHTEYTWFRENGFSVMKRSELLGMISRSMRGIAVAGTHGKTTVSAMIAHLLKQSDLDCTAFLGGISKNYESNLILGASEWVVLEADEYDRSFLRLYPEIAVITAMDADHLDIYGTHEQMKKAFHTFAGQVDEYGILLVKKGLTAGEANDGKTRRYTYAIEQGTDFHAVNIRLDNGLYLFDLVTLSGRIRDIRFSFPGRINLENAVAAAAIGCLLDIPEKAIREALLSFSGVRRRFDFQIRTSDLVYMDDYAHHPEELKACISSVREMFPGKKITGIFQPHLFTRTRDFAKEFAASLDLLDELILLDIYPAREEPLEGVSSDLIFREMTLEERSKCPMNGLLNNLEQRRVEVVLTLGAGDIDTMVEPVREMLLGRLKRGEAVP